MMRGKFDCIVVSRLPINEKTQFRLMTELSS